MRSQLRVHLKSTPDLERIAAGPLLPVDREAVDRELEQRRRSAGADSKDQIGLFEKAGNDHEQDHEHDHEHEQEGQTT
jgi:hypothetical protein